MKQLTILLTVALSALAGAQTPESTVQKFADAISSKDFNVAVGLVQGGKPSAELQAIAKQQKEWPTLTLSEMSAQVKGNQATVSYQLKMTGMSALQDHAESLSLVMSSTGWFIKAENTEPRGSNAVLPMLAYMFTHPQVMGDSQAAAKSTACLSNAKQLALACIMYSADNDDILKFGVSNWTTKIWPYTKNKRILTCSDEKVDAHGTAPVSYSINPKIAGKSFSKVKSPSLTVLLYEGKNGKLNFRHRGRASVAFCDGHVKLINAQQAKSLVWNP